VLLGEGDAPAAVKALRAAVKGWRGVGSPYEVARSMRVLAQALRAVRDDDDADLELRAALAAFQTLGARGDVEAVEREIREAADRRSGPVTTRMTFMFTDIVGSTSLAETLGDRAWEQLLRWHDDTLQGLIRRGGGEVVNNTGDGFFAAFESARSGIRCAIGIQVTARLASRLLDGGAPGIHLYTFNQHTAVLQVLERVLLVEAPPPASDTS